MYFYFGKNACSPFCILCGLDMIGVVTVGACVFRAWLRPRTFFFSTAPLAATQKNTRRAFAAGTFLFWIKFFVGSARGAFFLYREGNLLRKKVPSLDPPSKKQLPRKSFAVVQKFAQPIY